MEYNEGYENNQSSSNLFYNTQEPSTYPEDSCKAVSAEDETPDGVEVYKLYRPITFDGEHITELRFDFDSLSANDLMRAEREAKMRLAKKEQMAMPETNKKYNACVAAKAAGIKTELLFSLGAKDFTQVSLLAMNFLLDGDSSEEMDD